MRSLFLKIFLGFWVTVLLTGISLVLAFVLLPGGTSSRWHAGFEDTTRYFGVGAASAFGQDGVSGASEYIHRLRADAHIHACLFDEAGRPLAGELCSQFAGMAAQIARNGSSVSALERGLTRVGVQINQSDGRRYIYVSELLAGPKALMDDHAEVFPLRIAFAILVSGAICYFLTLYLTAPILKLRSVAQQIASGVFNVRAERKMELRGDELGDLVRDFNRMADKTEHLISSQRQLLFDVSHELRSPLARMNVAVDLLRERVQDDPSLNRIETDLQRLNEMIGRLLTVSKLEATTRLDIPMRVDIAELIASVVSDADFEAKERGSRVEIVRTEKLIIPGDSNLLRSAIENVLRNAVRFTQIGTTVEVTIRSNDAAGSREAVISIRDRGPGVPAQELVNIFRPFYRITDEGSRNSGGVGLGLAIAERIVHLHRGRIHATNEHDGGLRVELTFPAELPAT